MKRHMLDSAKSRIGDFLEARKRKSRQVEESDGPFRYEYVAISHVVGAQFPKDACDPLELAHFPDENATAYLTQNWDKQYTHIDRANAIGALIVSKFVGIRRFKRLSRPVNAVLSKVFGSEWVFLRNLRLQAIKVREKRIKIHSGSGCCLVYKAQGEIDQPIRLHASKRFRDIGFAIDPIDRGSISILHRSNVRNVLAVVSMVMASTDGSPEIEFLSDGTHLICNDGTVIYVRTVTGHVASVIITTTTSSQLADDVQAYVSGLSSDRKLSGAASLYAVSQHKSNDNLRAFMASWSALEILTNSLEFSYREDLGVRIESGQLSFEGWDKDLSGVAPSDYRLKDKFFVVAVYLGVEEAVSDAEEFAKINKIRGDYYHRLDFNENDLPARGAQKLFRKYLGLALQVDIHEIPSTYQ